MDSPTPSSEPSSSPTPNCRRALRRFIAAIAVLFLLAALFFVLARPGSKVAWLTPAELAQASKPGLLTQWRRKAMNLTAPLWRWYQPRRRVVSISSTVLTLPPAAAAQLSLGPPAAADTNGMRIWILSPAELVTVQQRLTSQSGADILAKSILPTVDGLQVYLNNSTPPSTVRGGPTVYIPPIVWLAVTPRIVSRSVNLTVAITAIQSPFAPAMPQTNVTPGFRASLPTTGGLLIDGANIKYTNGQSCWFVISPSILDANGNPIKP